MTETLVIIDYGSGNIRSAEKAFARAAADNGLDVTVTVSCEPDMVEKADRLVLPGVGAYGDCAAGIKKIDGLWEAIDQSVQHHAKPFFGICVGMQLMAKRGLEHGTHEGFGWLDGNVSDIKSLGVPGGYKMPHMGWNSLTIEARHPVLEGIETGDHVYFVHSYAMSGDIPVLASTDYGTPLTALVGSGSAIGSQFHPEKSQHNGLKLIANFLRWRP